MTTGRCVFDKRMLLARLTAAAPGRRVSLCWAGDGAAFGFAGAVDDPRGSVAVYEEPRPGVPYVIGADTAGEGSDWFVAQVLDNTNGRQVATLRQRADEDEFARAVCCLGLWYNTALLAIEVNFSTFPVREAERLCYPLQYAREVPDSYTGRTQRRHGFRTNSATRPAAIAALVKAAREDPGGIRDPDTLREMLTFVRSSQGRPEAMANEHDDCVMALAIAHAVRGQQRCEALAPEEESSAQPFDRQVAALLQF